MKHKIRMINTKSGWHWRIQSINGKILAFSEKYSSKNMAVKTIKSLISSIKNGDFDELVDKLI